MHLDKQIPHGGGLGGGSADAAAVLRWAGHGDLATAAALGADVPFCVVGGRARVRGIGEIVEPLPFEPRTVTLVVPPLGVSTPAVYRAWDELGGPTAAGANDLEPAALAVEPALARWRERIGELAGDAPTLAGSGATWFLPGERDDALAALRSEGAAVVVARTRRRCRGPGRSPCALLAALVARSTEHLLVLLLAHPLAALLDQRTHTAAAGYRRIAPLRDTVIGTTA